MTMEDSYVLSIDQGTSGTSASLYDKDFQVIAQKDISVSSTNPQPGWVEQDPYELLDSIRISSQQVITQAGIHPRQINCFGLANQGEPLVLWNIETGVLVYPVIGWQCVRSASACQQLINSGCEAEFRSRTGLPLHPEWPSTKVSWVLDHSLSARELLKNHRLAFSSLDTWFIFQLTQEKLFVTDPSTASRSGLYNIHTHEWDPFLIEMMGAAGLLLPQVIDSNGYFGEVDLGIGQKFP